MGVVGLENVVSYCVCGKRFPIKLKGGVYKNYVRPAILYGSEAWCMRDFAKDKELNGESNMWSEMKQYVSWPWQIVCIGMVIC